MTPIQIEPTWWISVIEIPVVAALFHMLHGLRRDLHARIDRADERDSEALGRTREDLAAFKLEVARTYVPLSLVREIDRRLSQQLLRIESKLEEVSRATTAAAAALDAAQKATAAGGHRAAGARLGGAAGEEEA
ncbi:hypothetical protein GCM10010964_41800 [Caldovatus sediminis]|uniref:Uncharacterized protein n=1 Tax=Caldovatus sediminis TaxID=2041189 RepID=A0A8J2ZFJ2_9PROT|nr:hypothetical protein [Caldovatus sediminis]GGG50171.1 hypothetical protein GCM10010964_41800 [Caldovatus sediminis]